MRGDPTMRILAERIEHEARVAHLLRCIEQMASSAANHGTPKAETIARVFNAARAVQAYQPQEETHV